VAKGTGELFKLLADLETDQVERKESLKGVQFKEAR